MMCPRCGGKVKPGEKHVRGTFAICRTVFDD